jgi:hypothetical protein
MRSPALVTDLSPSLAVLADITNSNVWVGVRQPEQCLPQQWPPSSYLHLVSAAHAQHMQGDQRMSSLLHATQLRLGQRLSGTYLRIYARAAPDEESSLSTCMPLWPMLMPTWRHYSC